MAYNLALSKLAEKVRGDLDLGVTLGELASTKRMFKATGKLISHAARGKPYGGYGSTHDVANGYLQYKYGWKPLMSDIFKIADERIRVTLNALEHVKASVRLPVRGGKIHPRFINAVPNVPVKCEWEGFQACQFKMALLLPTNAFRLDRWTSINPLSIGWELVPYSFVVDWVFDVGSYLRNLESALLFNASFKYGYSSEIRVLEGSETVDHYESHHAANQVHVLRGIAADYYIRNFRRLVLTSYPFPRRPTFNVDLSSGQMLSAAALLHQFLPRSVRVNIGGRYGTGKPGSAG
jgi:hypothetical protein